MTRRFLITILFFTFSYHLYSYRTPTNVPDYKEEIVSTIFASPEVTNYVVDFTISRDCLEELEKDKTYQENCTTEPQEASGNNTCILYGCMKKDDDLDKKKKEYSKSLSDNLDSLEKLIKTGKIAESKYSANDLKLVIETITNKNKTLRSLNLKKLVKPTFPSSLLFPWDQKDSIIKAIFERENIADNRHEKIKVLIDLAKTADTKITEFNLAVNATKDESSYSYDYIDDKDLDFYKKDEIDALNMSIEKLKEEKAETEQEIESYEYQKMNSENIDEDTGMTANEVDNLLKNLKVDLEQINADITEYTNEITELNNIQKEQMARRISLTNKVLASRVDTKGKLCCPNLLHLATYYKDFKTTKLVIDEYKRIMAIKTGDKDKTNQKVSRYLDAATYDSQKLSEAQNDYSREQNKKGNNNIELPACSAPATTMTLSKITQFGIDVGIVDREKANKKLSYRRNLADPSRYTPLAISYIFWDKETVKNTLDIILELIKSGATYKEDLTLVYDNKDRSDLFEKLPKEYSTIFEDFLMIGGGLDQYKKEKKDIIDALTTYHVTRAQKRNLKGRDLSLLKQAVDNKNAYWCKEILSLAKKDDGLYDSNLPYKAGGVFIPKSNKDQRRYNRACNWMDFIDGSNGNKMYYNKAGIIKDIRRNINASLVRKKNRTQKTILDDVAKEGSPCYNDIKYEYDKFLTELKTKLAEDLTGWNKDPNRQVYSQLHYQAGLKHNPISIRDFEKLQDYLYKNNKNILQWAVEKYGQKKESTTERTESDKEQIVMNSIGLALVDFIISAKDAYGNTPWDYGKNRAWRTSYTGDKANLKAVKDFLVKEYSLTL